MSRPRSRPVIRVLLIDLSGTLHIGDTPTQGAVDALNRIRKHNQTTSQSQSGAGIAIRFCSNTSKECTASLRARLVSMGFDVLEGELWTSLGALRDVVRVRNLRRPFFLLSDSAMEEFPEFTSDKNTDAERNHSEYDSVVVGLSPKHFNYETLTKAFRVLLPPPSSSSPSNPKLKPLITTHRAKYIRTSDGELSLGPGPFVTALEDALSSGSGFGPGSGSVRAEVVGKPTRTFFERVVASVPGRELGPPPLNAEAEGREGRYGDIAIIGDDVEADLGGAAIEMGFWRVLVKTGKYRPGDERRAGQHPPDEVRESFASFVDDLLSSVSVQE